LDGVAVKTDEIELEMQAPDFWQNHERAGRLAKELNDLKEEFEFWNSAENELNGYLEMDDTAIGEKSGDARGFIKRFNKAYARIFLSGKYDRGNAVLYVYACRNVSQICPEK